MSKGAVMIPKGTIVTCENGHQVCTIHPDIMPFEILVGHNFEDWKQDPPNPHAEINTIACSVCGAKWIGFAQDRGILAHTKDGWISVSLKP